MIRQARLFIFLIVAVFGVADGRAQPDMPLSPKLKSVPEISIPPEAMHTGVGGEVRVRVELNKDGSVSKVGEAYGPGAICRDVDRPDIVALRSAAVTAAKAARFEPLKKDQPDQTWIHFDIPAKATPADDEKLERFVLRSNTPELRDKILALPKPPYPAAARALRADGTVAVEMLVDEKGSVFSAKALSGHPLLRSSATMAACGSKFRPATTAGSPVKTIWVITYNFVP